MIVLADVNDSLEIDLAGAVTTNQLPFVVSYVDITTTAYTPAQNNGTTNNTTAVTLVAAPAASTQRQVKFLSVFNADTVSATVTIQLNDNATTRTIFKVVLATGETLIYTTTSGFQVFDANGHPKEGGLSLGAGLEFDTNSAVRMKENQRTRSITFVIDGGGAVITTGVKGYLEIPFACTIIAATLLADQSGSIVVDIWKDTYANYPPTDADSITSATPPTISSATKSQDTTLSSWTTSITAGDILGFNVDSATTVTRVTLSLKVRLDS